MIETVGFGVVALLTLLSALFVVGSSNLIHAVLWLGLTLVMTAALYAMLGASFLAGVQILVYVGGVITLMIFGVMITRRHDGPIVRAESGHKIRAAVAAVAFFGVVAAAIKKTPGLDGDLSKGALTPANLGHAFLGDQLLAFETLSVLLLAALVGAIVVARRRDEGAPVKATAVKRPRTTAPSQDAPATAAEKVPS